jgi:hypothetical protein
LRPLRRNQWHHIMISPEALAIDGRIIARNTADVAGTSDWYDVTRSKPGAALWIGAMVGTTPNDTDAYSKAVDNPESSTFGQPGPTNQRIYNYVTNTTLSSTTRASAEFTFFGDNPYYIDGLRLTFADPPRGKWWVSDFAPPGAAHYA